MDVVYFRPPLELLLLLELDLEELPELLLEPELEPLEPELIVEFPPLLFLPEFILILEFDLDEPAFLLVELFLDPPRVDELGLVVVLGVVTFLLFLFVLFLLTEPEVLESLSLVTLPSLEGVDLFVSILVPDPEDGLTVPVLLLGLEVIKLLDPDEVLEPI